MHPTRYDTRLSPDHSSVTIKKRAQVADGSFVSVAGGAQEEHILVGESKVIRRDLEEIQQLSVTERSDDWFELSDVPPRKATRVSPGTDINLLCCLAEHF